MNERHEKSVPRQELEVLEKYLIESPEHEIQEAAHYIFERVKLNIPKLQNTGEEALAPRFKAVFERVNKYLCVTYQNIGINYKNLNDFARDIKANIGKIPADIDLIVGVPRSGMLAAVIISENLNIPCESLDMFLDGKTIPFLSTCRKLFNQREVHNVLIIDDSIRTGESMDFVREQVSKANLDMKFNIKYAAVYGFSTCAAKIDFWIMNCEQPRVFQWNYLNHFIVQQSCWDIDGLLCLDPTDEQNDDGIEYEKFLRNARPIMIPKYEILAIVTSRLEKYREPTEEWLSRHGVKYKELYMFDAATAEERRRMGMHAGFKAKVYKSLNSAYFFYESDRKQAIEISKLSGKPCFCTTTDELF